MALYPVANSDVGDARCRSACSGELGPEPCVAGVIHRVSGIARISVAMVGHVGATDARRYPRGALASLCLVQARQGHSHPLQRLCQERARTAEVKSYEPLTTTTKDLSVRQGNPGLLQEEHVWVALDR